MNYLDLQQRIAFAVKLMSYPALTVQIFCRRKTGFRHLKPGAIVAMSLVMWLYVGVSANLPDTSMLSFASSANEAFVEPPLPELGWDAILPDNWRELTQEQQQAWAQKHRITDPARLKQQQEERQQEIARRQQAAIDRAESVAFWARMRARLAFWPMNLFVWAFLGLGLLQRRQRWNDLLRGVLWHSYSRGASYLTPLLGSYMREANILRFMDPLLCFGVALFVLQFSRAFGWWLMIATFCFYMVEQYVYEKQLDAAIDQHDNLVDSETVQLNMKHFKPGAAPVALPSMEEMGGVLTTGSASPELAAQVAKRREERRARLREQAAQAGEEAGEAPVHFGVGTAVEERFPDRNGFASMTGDLAATADDDRL